MQCALRLALTLAIVLATGLAVAGSQPAKGPTKDSSSPEVIELTVRPAPVPRPAVKYRLLPQYPDQAPGNAVSLYRRAALLLEQSGVDDREFIKLLSDPQRKLPPKPQRKPAAEKVRKALESIEDALRQTDLGARRERCDWDMPIREIDDIYELLMPELQLARRLARR